MDTKIEERELAEKIIDSINSMGFSEKQCAGYLVHCHRTLQQSIMRLVVEFIRQVADQEWCDLRNEASVKLAKEILKKVDYESLALPFI